jgi:hypothetical protein
MNDVPMKAQDGDTVYAVHWIDPARIIREETGLIRAWTRMTNTTNKDFADTPPYREARVLHVFDCIKRTKAFRQIVHYDGQGAVVASTTYKDGLEDVVPDSIGEGLLDAVCRAAPQKRSPPRQQRKPTPPAAEPPPPSVRL